MDLIKAKNFAGSFVRTPNGSIVHTRPKEMQNGNDLRPLDSSLQDKDLARERASHTNDKNNNINNCNSNKNGTGILDHEVRNFAQTSSFVVNCRNPINSEIKIQTDTGTLPVAAVNKNLINTTAEAQSVPAPAPSSKRERLSLMVYDPKVNTSVKPPYSFSSLIFMAIEDSKEKSLPVKEIYDWIIDHFPYFETAANAWKNGVRRSLSLNKSFLKVEKTPNNGRGFYWRIEENHRVNLLHSITRSPFIPCPILLKLLPEKTISELTHIHKFNNYNRVVMTPIEIKTGRQISQKISGKSKEVNFNVRTNNKNFWKIPTQNGKSDNAAKYSNNDYSADSIKIVDTATALLGLRMGLKILNRTLKFGTDLFTNSQNIDHSNTDVTTGGNHGCANFDSIESYYESLIIEETDDEGSVKDAQSVTASKATGDQAVLNMETESVLNDEGYVPFGGGKVINFDDGVTASDSFSKDCNTHNSQMPSLSTTASSVSSENVNLKNITPELTESLSKKMRLE